MIDPHKILTISSKRTFDTCPRRWSYSYHLNLAPKEVADALVRGTEFHEGAEATHSDGDSDKINTAKRLAYDRWVKKYDDLKTETSEIPMLVPLKSLYDYSGRISPPGIEEWYYGGVADALAVSFCGSRWILDHKTVERFYPVPSVFSLEQLGMYCVAYEILNNVTLTGGVISRVKQLEAHPEHILNHALKQIEGLTKSFLNVVLKRDKNKYSTSAEQVQNSTNTDQIQEQKQVLGALIHFSKIKLRPKGLQLGVTGYDSKGYLIQSVRDMRGQLVHVQRLYYPLTRAEKQQIVKDFLVYAEEIILSAASESQDKLSRRSPGLHCNQCPFRVACEAERITGTALGSCIDPEKFVVVAPHGELTSKMPGFADENSKQ